MTSDHGDRQGLKSLKIDMKIDKKKIMLSNLKVNYFYEITYKKFASMFLCVFGCCISI